jgi:predicted transcriptional regulator
MARLIDYIPEVIHEVQQAGEINQTELTEAVWGESGRGNTSLTQILFPEMVAKGLLTMRKAGRAKMFSVTQRGIDKMDAMCRARGYTVEQGRAPISYGEAA